MIYQAQFEVIDQDQPLSELGNEARRRMIEDILQLGMVLEGESSKPVLIDIDGSPWIQIEGKVRDAGKLLATAGDRA